MLLALDIGNTNVTVGIIENSELITIHRIESSTLAKEGLTELDLSKITKVIISSVVPQQTIDYQNQCKSQFNLAQFVIKNDNTVRRAARSVHPTRLSPRVTST